MPPYKKYIFEHINNSNIKIEIKAHSVREANELLVIITEHPEIFKLIE